VVHLLGYAARAMLVDLWVVGELGGGERLGHHATWVTF